MCLAVIYYMCVQSAWHHSFFCPVTGPSCGVLVPDMFVWQTAPNLSFINGTCLFGNCVFIYVFVCRSSTYVWLGCMLCLLFGPRYCFIIWCSVSCPMFVCWFVSNSTVFHAKRVYQKELKHGIHVLTKLMYFLVTWRKCKVVMIALVWSRWSPL